MPADASVPLFHLAVLVDSNRARSDASLREKQTGSHGPKAGARRNSFLDVACRAIGNGVPQRFVRVART
jgi:hypothetical protein